MRRVDVEIFGEELADFGVLMVANEAVVGARVRRVGRVDVDIDGCMTSN